MADAHFGNLGDPLADGVTWGEGMVRAVLLDFSQIALSRGSPFLKSAGNFRIKLGSIYDAEKTGLQSRVQQAKAAVASQFGRRSAEYKSVSKIRY